MNRIVSLTLLGLTSLLTVASLSQAEYRDGMNRYECVKSNPIVNRDPSGQWTEPEREKTQARARVCAETGDTWKSLADKIKLEPSEHSRWAIPDTPAPVPGQRYLIPNTVVVYTSKKTGADRVFFWTMANVFRSRAENLGRKYEAKKYRVIFNLEQSSDATFIEAWRTEGIAAYAFGGHGGQAGGKWYGYKATSGSDNAVGPDQVHPPYKLQAVGAYSCGSANVIEPSGFPPVGAPPLPPLKWRNLVSTNGGTFVGYHGAVNRFTESRNEEAINPGVIP